MSHLVLASVGTRHTSRVGRNGVDAVFPAGGALGGTP